MNIISSHENREITFYPRYSRLRNYFILFFFLDLFLMVLLIGCFLIAVEFLFVQFDVSPLLIRVIQLCLVLALIPLLFLVIGVSFFMFFTIRRSISYKPTLLAISQGIAIQDLPIIGNIFLSWNEIASLSVAPVRQSFSKPEHYLALDPKDHAQFLSHINPVRRVFVNLGSQATGTLVYVPPYYFSEPTGEVLLQIQEHFQEELQKYEIQVFNIALKG